MTVSGLLGTLAVFIALLALGGAVVGTRSKRASAQRSLGRAATQNGANPVLGRLVGLIELVLALPFIVGGIASLPVGVAPLAIGLALLLDGFQRLVGRTKPGSRPSPTYAQVAPVPFGATAMASQHSGPVPPITPPVSNSAALPRKILLCPHCQRPSDCTNLTGTVTCPACGKSFWVPAAPPPQQVVAPAVIAPPGRNVGSDKVAQLQRRADHNRRQTILISLGLVLVLVLITAGVIYRTLPKTPREKDQQWGDIVVYVDNATNEPCEIVIDGEVRDSVAARSFGSVRLLGGERQVGVSQKGAWLTNQLRQLVKPSGAEEGKFLLIVGQVGNYGEYIAEYEGGGSNFPFRMPRFITSEAEVHAMYRDMVKKLPVRLDIQPWTDLSKYQDVLTQPPREAWLPNDSQQPLGVVRGQRRVFTRLSASDLEFIKDAHERAARGSTDLDSLKLFMQRMTGWK